MMANVLLCLTSLVLAGLRIAGIKHAAFQAAAHLFVGGLGGAWLADGGDPNSDRSIYLWLIAGLSVVEVACALFFFLAG